MDKRIDNMDEADDDADAADFDCVQLVNECLEKLAHERLTVQDVDQMIMDAFGWKDISPTLGKCIALLSVHQQVLMGNI